jgi:catechol 2,3-dioxygenase-like lactoylglutathione lyase family enzyme
MKIAPARIVVIAAFVLASFWAGASARAQLLPVNDTGLTMGHVLVNVSSVEEHKRFWVDAFGAKPVKVGKLEGVTIPGLVLLFRTQTATGPGEGEIINHLGLKLTKLSDFTARFEKGGWKYDPPRVGREGTVQTYVTGPDTFRMELVEDPKLPAPAVSHHLHYWLAEQSAIKKWYVETLHLAGTMRGPYPSGDVPGMNLTFAPLGSQKVAGVPTRGRLMDSIGFEVPNLQAYVSKLKSDGVKFDVPYGRDPELGIPSATLTDPWGTTIRLTEGLSKAAGVTSYTYIDGFVTIDQKQ